MIKPLGSRILVEPIKESAEYRTTGGLIIGDTEFKAPQALKAKVLAHGSTVKSLSIGDVILVSQFAPTQVKEKPGDTTLIVPEEDVLGVVSPDKV